MYKVEKKYLLLLAGLLWMPAGAMITSIGLPFLSESAYLVPMIVGAVVVFMIFYFFIFSPLVYKHEKRIRAYDAQRLPFWWFFDLKSYLIMAMMMTVGYSLRTFHLVPTWFIGFFYTGLGIALFACGFRFAWRHCLYHKGHRIIPRLEKRTKK